MASNGPADAECLPVEPPAPKKRRVMVLEALRGAAATCVLVCHLGGYLNLSGSRFSIFLTLGQEAVILFFLLSGFVIQMTTSQSGQINFRDYFIKRFRRIYPIFLMALVLAYAGEAWRSSKLIPLDLRVLLGNIFMLQDYDAGKPGAWFPPYMQNGPLWSLAYEWWFYALFYPLFRFVPANARRRTAFGISLLAMIGYAAYPNGASLYGAHFAIWWAGAEMAREYVETRRVTLRRQWESIVGLLLLAGIWCVITFKIMGMKYTSPGITPLLQVRQYLAAALMMFIGIVWRERFSFKGMRFTIGPFALIAPISYAVYCIHWPIIGGSNFLAGILPEPFRLIVLLTILFVLAYLLEVTLQGWINRVTNRWLTTAKNRPPRDQAARLPAMEIRV